MHIAFALRVQQRKISIDCAKQPLSNDHTISHCMSAGRSWGGGKATGSGVARVGGYHAVLLLIVAAWRLYRSRKALG